MGYGCHDYQPLHSTHTTSSLQQDAPLVVITSTASNVPCRVVMIIVRLEGSLGMCWESYPTVHFRLVVRNIGKSL